MTWLVVGAIVVGVLAAIGLVLCMRASQVSRHEEHLRHEENLRTGSMR